MITDTIFVLLVAFGLLSYASIFIFTIAERYYAEIPFVIVVFFTKSVLPSTYNNAVTALSKKWTLAAFVFLIAMGILGVIKTGDALAVYPDVRASCFLVGSLAIFFELSKKNDRVLSLLPYSCLIACIINTWAYFELNNGEYGKSSTIIGVPLAGMAIGLLKDKRLFTLIFAAAAITLGVLSGYRVYIILSVLLVIINIGQYMVIMRKRGTKNLLQFAILGAIIFIPSSLFISNMTTDILATDVGVNQLGNKTENLLRF